MKTLRSRFFLFALLFVGVQSGADTVDAKVAEAAGALQRGDHVTAIRTLENLEGGGDRWEVPFWLGTAHLLEGNLDDAALLLDDALTLESDLADLWVQRAVIAQERGRARVALQFLEVAVQVDAKAPLAYLNAAIAYESLGDAESARGAYGRFLRLAAEGKGSNRMRRLRRDVLNRIAASGD